MNKLSTQNVPKTAAKIRINIVLMIAQNAIITEDIA